MEPNLLREIATRGGGAGLKSDPHEHEPINRATFEEVDVRRSTNGRRRVATLPNQRGCSTGRD
jgi:hypothetical protein